MSPVPPDLLRDMLLAFEELQRSPPEPVFFSFEEASARFGCSEASTREALDILSRLALIEGPGPYATGWLFRQVTPKGREMADQIATGRQWRNIKRLYNAP